MTWRSTVKAKAREWVVWHYPLGGHQSAKENLANMQELVRSAMFVRDGTGEDICPLRCYFQLMFILQGMTKNMASLALTGLITEFFYAGPSALGGLFPEVFAWEVLKSVVCYEATAVSNHLLFRKCSLDLPQLQAAIDEFTVTGTQQDQQFEYATYSKVYMQLMGMQAKIDANPKHATMTRALRILWATTGRWVLMPFFFLFLMFYLAHHLMMAIWRSPVRKTLMSCLISFFYLVLTFCLFVT